MVVSSLTREAYGPSGDPDSHLSLRELRHRWQALPPASTQAGVLRAIVRRLADGSRERLQQGVLSSQEGLQGDGWARRPPRDPEAQLAVMAYPVATLIANGQPLTVFGDNLFVDLDITMTNLPTGSRLRVGAAEVVVTPKPHTGCAKFHKRFGDDALRFVQGSGDRSQRLRGVFWRVVQPGNIWQGAEVTVLARTEGDA